ncbi:MAG: hypothetical protein IJM68_01145 [Synergistaceae bacterium]|nr:hypothetical protein [Synergistaceae bacterium]
MTEPRIKKRRRKAMKSMKEYEEMSVVERESFLAHASADLAEKLYYENDMEGLIVVAKNLGTILERVKNSIECLEMLRRGGDVYSKIYLLLEYMGKGGISEAFIAGLEELTERAQETYASGMRTPESEAEEQEVLKRLNAVIDRNDIEMQEVV